MDRHSPVLPFRSNRGRHRPVATAFATIAATIWLIAAIPLLAMAQTVKMHGTVAPGVSTMGSAGHLDPAKTLTLDIRFALRNRAQLDQLIAAQMDRGSPSYHQWITPDEFTRRFGTTDTDYSALKNWLAANGFQIIGGSREEGYLRFSGNAASVERAFKTQLDDFGNGKFANVTEPEIPAQFADVIGDILGLHNLGRLQPDYVTRKLKQGARKLPISKRAAHTGPVSGPDFNLANLGGSGFAFAAPDFYSFYDENLLLNAGNTGANGSDCIGIFANTNIYPEPAQATILSDYFSFFSQYTSFSTDPSVTIDLSKETDPGVIGDGADIEAYLDIEAAHVIAPGAPITLYVTNPNKLSFAQNLSDAVTAMTTENTCAALNFSYHICGATTSFLTTTLGDLFSKAQTNGQSVFVSSGDHGVDMCETGSPNVNELGANPLITSVGGAESSPTYDENGFATGYSTESAWNEQTSSTQDGESLVSGGGASAVFTKPAWQTGVAGTSNDNARDLPDVASLAGRPGIVIYADTDNSGKASPTESIDLEIGTSLASPLWAGYSRLLQTANGGKRLGSLNPTIWELGVAGQAANGFHDITSGDNTYISDVSGKPVTVPGYSAGPGYDLVTGWGSIDANSFVTAYINAPTPAPTPTPPVPSKLGATPTSLKFATTIVDAASKVKKLTLVNEAAKKGGVAITLSGFTMTSNIESAAGGTCTVGEMLAPKAKCTLAFTMTPSAGGTNSGSVGIMSNSSEGGLTINASVTGKVPKVPR